jgi:biotin-(acetyl-CoA carboxylase) ligase
MEHAAGLNGDAMAMIGDREVRGIFRGLAADGAMILELANGAQQHVHAGDVRFTATEVSSG